MQPPRPDSTTTPRQSDQVVLDPFHAAIVDAICASDAGRAALGELIWLRRATEHEFCMPGSPCWSWPTQVIVRVIGSGVRIRQPLPAGWLDAAP